jgi:hypothetical protein
MGKQVFAVTKRLNTTSFTATNAASTMTVATTPTIPILNGATLLSGYSAANLPATVVTAVAGGGTGAYTMNRAGGTITPATNFTAQVGPTITTFNPDAASAEVRDAGTTGAAVGNCTATTLLNTSDDGFSLLTTANASTAAGNNLVVHWTAEIEIP